MATLSPAQIYALARNAGLSAAAATTATAVALAESGGRTDAVGDQGLEDATWGPSIGLWQIRSLKSEYGTGSPRDAARLTDPAFNASSMAAISGTGTNFKPWTTYTSGKYRSYLGDTSSSTPITAGSSAADSGAGGDSGGTGSGSVASSLGGLWEGGAFTVGMKIAAAVAAGALVIVGATHTVSDK